MRALLIFIIIYSSLASAAKRIYPSPGIWRFHISYPHTDIPFLLELEPGKKGWKAHLINGKENVLIENILISKNKWILPLGVYQNFLEVEFLSKNQAKGFFVKATRNPHERVPIKGSKGGFRRFDRTHETPLINLNGKWELEIIDSENKSTKGIAVFGQTGASIDANIITPTGDLRYMDGIVTKDEFIVAGFDGVFHYVFKGKVSDNSFKGELLSKNKSVIIGKKNDKITLPSNPIRLNAPLDFGLKNLEGKTISIKDPAYRNKPLLIQIFGSWCPNCIDESTFLLNWKSSNNKPDLNVLTLAFERHQNEASAIKHLKRFVKQKNFPFPILLAGWNSEQTPMTILKGLDNFTAYPTILLLNKNHELVWSHEGFKGPGSGDFYLEFSKEFEHQINLVLGGK